MARTAKFAIAACLVLAIAYIFVLPAFNVSPTALRAARNADLLFTSMAAAAYLLTKLRPQLCGDLQLPTIDSGPVSDLIDLTCIRLC